MRRSPRSVAAPDTHPEQLDVAIVGAGLSGIGCACYLRREHPGLRFALFEARGASGGTWDQFRYPGVRADSDPQTLAFELSPWPGEAAFAPGAEILRYIRALAARYQIERHIRLRQRVRSAAWSSEQACWQIEVHRTGSGTRLQVQARWLLCAAGYFSYDAPYTPELPGITRYRGRVVHPQRWPSELEWAGKQVVVLGSGATAVTLVPALAQRAAHVTMLQRSPTYIVAAPSRDPLDALARRLLGARSAYRLIRRKNIVRQAAVYRLCRRYPRTARAVIRRLTARQLPGFYPLDRHFKPRYDPWDQRLCLAPDGDVFRAIREQRATVVTDTIETFTADSVRLRSGASLPAELLITATGFRLQAFGGIALSVDGQPVGVAERLAFRGMMVSGVPNFAYLLGYANGSWTLRVELVIRHLCRLLAHMRSCGHDVCVPRIPYPNMTTRPLLNLSSGYLRRSGRQFPRQGAYPPWRVPHSYFAERRMLEHGPIAHPDLHFSSVP